MKDQATGAETGWALARAVNSGCGSLSAAFYFAFHPGLPRSSRLREPSPFLPVHLIQFRWKTERKKMILQSTIDKKTVIE